MSLSNFLSVLFLTTTVLLGVLYGKSIHKNINAEANIAALTDTLEVYKTKDGRQVAVITSFEEDKLSDLLKIQSRDSSITRLQGVIKQNKNASTAVVISNDTKVEASTPTTITNRDTVDNYIYPTYRSEIKLGRWVNGYSLASRDSTHYDLTVHNDYDVVLKRESGRLNAYVINHNPYTNTTMQRAASTSTPRDKRFGIGPLTGIGFNQQGKATWIIGVGGSFHIIKL